MEQIDINVMSNTETSDELRQLIVDRLNSGFSAIVIGEMFSVNSNTVLQVYKKYQKTGLTSNGKGVEPKKLNVKRVTPLTEDVNTPEVTNGVPKIIINDILDELRDENNSLLNENNRLLSENKIICHLLVEYRKCLLNYHNLCECNQKSNNNLLIECLESLYEKNKQIAERDVPKDVERGTPHKDSNNLMIQESTSRETPQEISSPPTQSVSLRQSPRLSKLAALPNPKILSETNNRLKCDFKYCDKMFKNIDNLNTHKNKFHSSMRINSFSDTNNTDIDSESNIHPKRNNSLNELKGIDTRDGNMVLCDYEGCPKTFKKRDLMLEHKRRFHTQHKFRCDFPGCKYASKRTDVLKLHKLTHSGARDFVCTLKGCSKKLAALPNPEILSETYNRFKCDFKDCDKTFKSIENLSTHKRKYHPSIRINSFSDTNDNDIDSESNIQPKRGESLNESSNELKGMDTRAVNMVLCDYKGCTQTFKKRDYMIEHKRRFHTEPKFRCDWPGCEYVSKRTDVLRLHKVTHSAARDLVCTFKGCSKRFKTNDCLYRHKECHLKKHVCCWPECTERFASNKKLVDHMRRHQNIRPFKCSFNGCVKDFFGKHLLSEHIRKMHKSKQIGSNSIALIGSDHKFQDNLKTAEIETNDIQLNSSSDVTNDNNIDSESNIQQKREESLNESSNQLNGSDTRDGNIFSCDYKGCSQTFTKIYNLNRHRKHFHAEPKYRCYWPGCGVAFKRKDELKSHEATHSESRDFICTFKGCSKRFKTYSVLRIHKQSHIKKYVCCWPGCTERFSYNRLLTNHMRKHQNIRPFKCYFDGCVKEFGIKPVLDQHIRRVHKS